MRETDESDLRIRISEAIVLMSFQNMMMTKWSRKPLHRCTAYSFTVMVITYQINKYMMLYSVDHSTSLESDRNFRGTYCLQNQGARLMLKVVLTSETSGYFCETTRRNTKANFRLHTSPPCKPWISRYNYGSVQRTVNQFLASFAFPLKGID